MLNSKLLKLRIIKSRILILFPLSIIIIFVSSTIFVKEGRHLTPYSVQVRGYYRGDGTYIKPHTRRPSGGAIHDAPYEENRSICMIFVLIGTGILCYSLYSFKKLTKKELLWVTQHEILIELKNTFNLALPKIKSKKAFPFYYMDNYPEYQSKENKFINSFLLKYKNITDTDFDNIDFLKKTFKDYAMMNNKAIC